MNSGWLTTVRAILELLYFIAGIVIAGAAIWGLQQIRLTKRIASINAKRESLKFAAERCQYFAEQVAILEPPLLEEHKKLGLTLLATNVEFEISDGEIAIKSAWDQRLMAQQYAQITRNLTAYMNFLEAFAIPFAAGVADDELGFQETATAFCGCVRRVILAIVLIRKAGVRYESCTNLYDCWSKRLLAHQLRKNIKDLESKIKTTPEPKIKPMDSF